jgi:hypothetical protein
MRVVGTYSCAEAFQKLHPTLDLISSVCRVQLLPREMSRRHLAVIGKSGFNHRLVGGMRVCCSCRYNCASQVTSLHRQQALR